MYETPRKKTLSVVPDKVLIVNTLGSALKCLRALSVRLPSLTVFANVHVIASIASFDKMLRLIETSD